jgi:sulfate/thiosulfate transport system substrate-binding protein
MNRFLAGFLSSGERRRQIVGVLAIVGLAAAVLLGRLILTREPRSVRLVVYGFSTLEEVLTQSLLPAFEAAWEAETGRDLTVEAVFGASGTLAGQINLGAPADVAVFSNAAHVDWLRFARRMRRNATGTVIGGTPLVIVTRPGNPAGIEQYADLARPGLVLLHADPRSSGVGEWAVLAVYGSALLETGDPEAARAQLEAVWRNVRVVAPSARALMTLFELGAGDALITYEHDALLALERGADLEIVIPERTIVAEHVAAIVDDNVTVADRPVSEALVDYFLGEAGQQAFRRYHFRPAWDGQIALDGLSQPFSVEALGGWSQAHRQLVEGVWKADILPQLNLDPPPQVPDGTGG